MTKSRSTRAQEVYTEAYRSHSCQPGMPDRKIFANLHVEGLKILSLGSGNGSDLWFVSNRNLVYALDSSPTAIAEACANGLIGAVADLEQPLPFADATFDVVVAKDIIEHLIAPDFLLQEINRVLKSSGRLVLSVPNHFFLPFRLRLLFGGNLIWKSLLHDHRVHFEEWNYMHLRFFTWGGLQRLLKVTGFRVQQAFWDFGTLAHYSNPDMFREHLLEKYAQRPLTWKAKAFLYVLFPFWRLFNLIFPRRLRHLIVGMAPGLLSAGYYLHCRKQGEQ